MKLAVALALAASLVSSIPTAPQTPASSTEAAYEAAARNADAKFQHIIANSERNPPDQSPTILSEREINAWFQAGRVKLPIGVKRVSFKGLPGAIEANAQVDFDEITASRRSSNPLLSLFSGVHEVHAVARAAGSGGTGRIDVERVELDGVTIPRTALEFFIDRYIRPKNPEVGLHSEFKMPYRIDLAVVGERSLTLTQK